MLPRLRHARQALQKKNVHVHLVHLLLAPCFYVLFPLLSPNVVVVVAGSVVAVVRVSGVL